MRWGISKKDNFFERKIKLVFKQNFGFIPKDLFYYKEALMHRSALERKPELRLQSNERLEFLGDSFLGSYTAAFLFKKYPEADEGQLTKLRSKIVSRIHLNKLALDLHLNILVKNAIARGQEANTIYGNALEAVIGAIYLEKGQTFLNTVLDRIFEQYINVKSLEETETDYKSKLFEIAQRDRKNLQFSVVKEEVLHNRKYYTVEVTYKGEKEIGQGYSKKKGEQEAAQNLINRLNL